MRNPILLNAVTAAALMSALPSALSFSPVARRQPQPNTAVRLIADSAMETEGEKEESNHGDESDWIPSPGGGFIPNFKSRLTGHTSTAPPRNPVLQVTDLQSYKTAVVDEPSRIVCVRFFAPWCRACKAVEGHFKALAKDHPDVKFVQVPLTKENAYLHRGLDIPSLPYAHVYVPRQGLVEERSMHKRKFASFRRSLETYVDGECEVWYDDDGMVDGSTLAGSESE